MRLHVLLEDYYMADRGDGSEALMTIGRKRVCVALVTVLILSVIGAVIAFELTDVYKRARLDPDFQSFCAVSEGMNCETVALSDYSTLAGVPVSVWATAGYFFAFFLALVALLKTATGFGRGFLVVLGLVFLVASVALVYIMAVSIESFCVLCLALDAVNVGIFAMAIIAVKIPGDRLGATVARDFTTIFASPATAALVICGAAVIMAGGYFYGRGIGALDEGESMGPGGGPNPMEELDSPENWADALNDRGDEQCGPDGHHQNAKGLQMGVTDEGHQWVGGLNPVLEIQEFTDYECPYCRKAHLMLRKLISKYPGKIKVFHRHYPLSNKCNRAIGAEGHKRACELSAISVCAGKQGRFWEMNDFLFQHAKEIRSSKLAGIDIAKRLELDLDEFTCCMDDSATMDAIKKDVEDGIGLTLKGTPAFLIDGKVYYGKIPEEAVARISAD